GKQVAIILGPHEFCGQSSEEWSLGLGDNGFVVEPVRFIVLVALARQCQPFVPGLAVVEHVAGEEDDMRTAGRPRIQRAPAGRPALETRPHNDCFTRYILAWSIIV